MLVSTLNSLVTFSSRANPPKWTKYNVNKIDFLAKKNLFRDSEVVSKRFLSYGTLSEVTKKGAFLEGFPIENSMGSKGYRSTIEIKKPTFQKQSILKAASKNEIHEEYSYEFENLENLLTEEAYADVQELRRLDKLKRMQNNSL